MCCFHRFIWIELNVGWIFQIKYVKFCKCGWREKTVVSCWKEIWREMLCGAPVWFCCGSVERVKVETVPVGCKGQLASHCLQGRIMDRGQWKCLCAAEDKLRLLFLSLCWFKNKGIIFCTSSQCNGAVEFLSGSLSNWKGSVITDSVSQRINFLYGTGKIMQNLLQLMIQSGSSG